MDRSAVKETRQVLRRVQEHLCQAHLALGAQRENFGLVDIIYHPSNQLPLLNYVTPRKGTAWISGKDVEQGLDHLHERQRMGRVQYVEGLFPLRELGLRVEHEVPIMFYVADGSKIARRTHSKHLALHMVKDPQESAIWWYVWRNAFYDVLAGGIEPLFVGRDVREIMMGRQVDIILYCYGFPVGVTRVTLYDKTAHIAALAVMKEHRSAETLGLLRSEAMKAAVAQGCTLIFAPGETEEDRRQYRELGFVDSGSVVCYSEGKESSGSRGEPDGPMEQPVLVLR